MNIENDTVLKESVHITIGLVAVGLGLQGATPNWQSLLNSSSGQSSLFLIVSGALATVSSLWSQWNRGDESILKDLTQNMMDVKDDE